MWVHKRVKDFGWKAVKCDACGRRMQYAHELSDNGKTGWFGATCAAKHGISLPEIKHDEHVLKKKNHINCLKREWFQNGDYIETLESGWLVRISEEGHGFKISIQEEKRFIDKYIDVECDDIKEAKIVAIAFLAEVMSESRSRLF